MVFPLSQECLLDLFLILHVDDVDDHRFRLQKPVASVHRLNEIVEFIVDPDKYLPVTISLEITSGS